jgi:glycosyltransferase involved in cell wall biosynthesis
MTGRVSVLVPTHNRARFLAASLESIFSQTLAPYEVIVIDDGCTDETAEIVRPYGDRLTYLAKPNGGKPTALNLGLEHVRGDYVWIMDDDDIALPHALERLVAPLEADQALGMSFSTHLVADTLSDGSLGKTVEHTIPRFPDSDLFPTLLRYGNFIGQSALVARMAVYRQVGPYNTTLVRSQDFDMLLRLSVACKAIRVPGPVYIYRHHEGSRGSDADRFVVAQKARKWAFYNKLIYRQLLRDIPLQRYLSASESLPLSDIRLRRAHLQRMGMLWRGGLFAELFYDLEQAVKVPGPLSDEERQALSAGSYPLDGQEGYWDRKYIQLIRRRTHNGPGPQIRLFLAQGVYWRARAELARRHYRFAWRHFQAALWILGLDGMLSAMAYKFRRLTTRRHISDVCGSVDAGNQSGFL